MESNQPMGDPDSRAPEDASIDARQKARKFALGVGLVPVMFFGLFGVFACFMMQSWIPIAFFGGFGCIVGTGLGLVTYLGARKKLSNLQRPWQDVLVAPYREFAEQVGGKLVAQESTLGGWLPGMPEYVDFLVDGNKAVLRSETDPGRQGFYLRLAINLSDPTDLRCHVYEQDLVSKITGTDIELGWERFDKQFAVTAANRSDLVPLCLTRHVQEALLTIQDWLRQREHRGNVELFVERHQVAVRVNVLFENVDDLMTFYRLGVNLYEELKTSLR